MDREIRLIVLVLCVCPVLSQDWGARRSKQPIRRVSDNTLKWQSWEDIHVEQFKNKGPSTPAPPTPPTPSSSNASTAVPLQVGGIFPSLAVTASSGPARSECGVGALMPWADGLYMVSYLSVPDAGTGTGLYRIEADLQMKKLADHNATFANRLLHRETSQIVIGAWVIDLQGEVKAIPDMLHIRVAATAEHLTDPQHKVYMLSMDGPLYECDVIQLNCTQLFDLVKELDIPADRGEQPHFKAAHSMDGRLLVASNTFEEADFTGAEHGGRLAEWRGPGSRWTVLETTAFVEVTGRRNFGKVIYALGWDFRSAILKTFDPNYGRWQTWRLPKASHAYDHLWQTEWPRIREVETERYLVDMHGLLYELSPLGWAGTTFGLRPVAQHLRMIPDFTSFRGMLVMGGNQVSSIFDNNVVTGQAQSGLWFGKTDDLWGWGKPQGWGAVWRRDNVTVGQVSDPFLMTGFDKKMLYFLWHDISQGGPLVVEVDVTGAAGHLPGEEWVQVYHSQNMDLKSDYFVFPPGFSAHWVRLRSEGFSGTVTAYFHYT